MKDTLVEFIVCVCITALLICATAMLLFMFLFLWYLPITAKVALSGCMLGITCFAYAGCVSS